MSQFWEYPVHAHREIEPQPSASLAQTVLTVEHSGTEHERRHGAALRNLEAVTSRLAIHVPSPAVAAATFLPASPQIVVCRPPLSAFALASVALFDFFLCGGGG